MSVIKLKNKQNLLIYKLNNNDILPAFVTSCIWMLFLLTDNILPFWSRIINFVSDTHFLMRERRSNLIPNFSTIRVNTCRVVNNAAGFIESMHSLFKKEKILVAKYNKKLYMYVYRCSWSTDQ